MSFNEPYFAPMSNYSNQSKGMPVDSVEAWLDQFPQKRAENKPNGGIIQSLADTRELYLRPMIASERKAARAKAQREHRQALKNLAKQEAQDAKEIAKQLTVWRREEAKRSQPEREMTTELGQQVLDKLRKQGFYDPSEFPLSVQYIRKIITQIRALGYTVTSERRKRRILRYVLNKQ